MSSKYSAASRISSIGELSKTSDSLEHFIDTLSLFLVQDAAAATPSADMGCCTHSSPVSESAKTQLRIQDASLERGAMESSGNFDHEAASHSGAQSSLRQIFSLAKPCRGCQHTDPVTEAGLFLLRSTRLLEQHIQQRAQQQFPVSLNISSNTLPSSDTLPLRSFAASNRSISSIGTQGEKNAVSLIHGSGRRYAVSGFPSSTPQSSTVVSSVQGELSSSVSSSEAKKEQPACSSSFPLSQGNPVADEQPLLRFHAELTLQLHQCFCRSMSDFDAEVRTAAEEDPGLCGILTHPRAMKLQNIFMVAVEKTLSDLVQRWREEKMTSAASEASVEVAEVLDRLRLADAEGTGHGMGTRGVHEIVGYVCSRQSPPPFTTLEAGGGKSYGGTLSRSRIVLPPNQHAIDHCLGARNMEYCAKLVAQHLWCAQRVLIQRFPAYGGPWDHIAQARYFIESLRSPTPTVPRCGSSTESLHLVSLPVSDCFNVKNSPDSTVLSPHKAEDLLHDGSTPPPHVDGTQRKGERPSRSPDFNPSTLHVLHFSGSDCGDMTSCPRLEKSSTVQPASSPALLAPRLPDLLIDLPPCPLWESYLSLRHITTSDLMVSVKSPSVQSDYCDPIPAPQHPWSADREFAVSPLQELKKKVSDQRNTVLFPSMED